MYSMTDRLIYLDQGHYFIAEYAISNIGRVHRYMKRKRNKVIWVNLHYSGLMMVNIFISIYALQYFSLRFREKQSFS